ncbi:Glycosyl transferase family 8 [Synechococcus sp. PCC 7335]|uniref:glycosyl transferase family 8 n=1 Tax=Synechococcus sp. (strain ATCC 29403 / PCC 7335) TaxID=91464 RepID=UPI00017EDC5E|nr:glycosyl transferase family 8 [Synechococcus sp. PCC 7335]EDX84159.1 Glycosyl transferase family 8 [Synechococcus sp. PCC 7335]
MTIKGMNVEIVFSLNRKIWLSLIVAMNSIVSNASNPDTIRFNVLVPPGEEQFFEKKIREALPSLAAQWRVKSYLPPAFMQEYLDKRFKEKTEDRRNSRYIQYSRFFFRDAFEDLERVIYLDTDLIVLGDIAELYAYTKALDEHCYFGSIPHFYPCIFYFSNFMKMREEIPKFKQTFNAGVWFTNLSFWNEKTYERLNYYLSLDAKSNYKLYTLGDEPVFNLMFKDYLQADKNWNRCGYGTHPAVTNLFLASGEKFLSEAKLIHWSGPFKPWSSPKIRFADLWRTYLPTPLAADYKSYA